MGSRYDIERSEKHGPLVMVRTKESKREEARCKDPLSLPCLLRQNLRWVVEGAQEISGQKMPLHSAQSQHGSCTVALVEGLARWISLRFGKQE